MTEREIFIRALQLASADERRAFLNRACESDNHLREELETLLAEEQALGGFLERPHRDVVNRTPASTIRPEAWVDRYRLVELVGEGGMGSVWAADQAEPVKRRVALKLIKPGMDSRQVLVRFEAERQALALMNHPSIARVYDGGMTSDGHPYFVMEFVAGIPITDYCHRAQVPLGERLRLFVQVCHAVHHAHQKGVIHRDLKPSNILVCHDDGVPVPKIIDFGLAKAVRTSLTERSHHTAHGLMLGTPLYMSPEQAELDNADIDTRADIYSLGVILYELLTGTTPVDPERVTSLPLPEVLRQIKEREPPKPSTKMGRGRGAPGTEAGGTGRRRSTRVPRWQDLDWIVMKALEKERARRYASASALADDVGRYLSGDAVEAGPPSAVYRLSRFVQKQRGWILTVAGIAVMLALSAAVSLWQAYRARSAETVARAAQQQAMALAAAERKARQDAEQASQLAARRRAESTAVLDFVQNHIFRSLKRSTDDAVEPTFRQAIQAALPLIESRFKTEPLLEASLRTSLARAFVDLNDWQMANAQYSAAHALYAAHAGPENSETLLTACYLAYSYDKLGRHEDALRLYRGAYEIQRRTLGPKHRTTLWNMQQAANGCIALGRYAEGLALHEEAHAIRKVEFAWDDADVFASIDWLAAAYARAGQRKNAVRYYDELLAATRQKHGVAHEDTLWWMRFVAYKLFDLGQVANGIRLLEEELEIRKNKAGPHHRDTLTAAHVLAECYFEFGRRDAALALREATLAARKEHLGPTDRDTLLSMQALAISYGNSGRRDKAIRLDEQALEVRNERLGPEHSETLSNLNTLANHYAAAGRHQEALEIRQQVLNLRMKTVEPNHPHLLIIKRNLARSYSAVGRHDEAIALAAEALEQHCTAFGIEHRQTFPARRILATCYAAAGRHEEARREWCAALPLHRAKFPPEHPDTLSVLKGLAESLVALGRPDEARTLLDECRELAAGQLLDPEFVAAADELRRCRAPPRAAASTKSE